MCSQELQKLFIFQLMEPAKNKVTNFPSFLQLENISEEDHVEMENAVGLPKTRKPGKQTAK